MSRNVSLRLPTTLEHLEHVNKAVDELAKEESWPPALIYQVNLSLEELIVNIITHGHNSDPTHEFSVVLNSDADTLSIELRDDGPPFNPFFDAPEPDTSSKLANRPIGGLGVYLVLTMMDKIDYRREDDHNVLILVKRKDNGNGKDEGKKNA